MERQRERGEYLQREGEYLPIERLFDERGVCLQVERKFLHITGEYLQREGERIFKEVRERLFDESGERREFADRGKDYLMRERRV